MPGNDASLIGKVLNQLSRAPAYAERGVKDSILVASAASYGAHSEDDLTQPTGFDPEAWCPDCSFYKLRRTPKKRSPDEYRY